MPTLSLRSFCSRRTRCRRRLCSPARRGRTTRRRPNLPRSSWRRPRPWPTFREWKKAAATTKTVATSSGTIKRIRRRRSSAVIIPSRTLACSGTDFEPTPTSRSVPYFIIIENCIGHKRKKKLRVASQKERERERERPMTMVRFHASVCIT